MKFSVLVAIVPEDQEQDCIDAARDLGAGGVTVLAGRGISNTAKKTFFGLTYDGSQSILVMVLEKGLSLDILKAIQHLLMPEKNDSRGLVFTLPLEHLGGIDLTQVEKFEQHVKDSL
ncbi:transcriptional regulator [Marinobacter panjinensis]|uniref:Transcriptional regulator n=1 Tax=Marinobacter panjinensis TaxID=2576384 RepID=A0A4U6R673_9GAMM|nr:transcriptional regulator [Marinobacter panjinensis]MCR8914731.1 transcriptional regulator [Marinobacter panjinensis]TKV68458.1 transcriptional regulator [Marinobacter panjinensis]